MKTNPKTHKPHAFLAALLAAGRYVSRGPAGPAPKREPGWAAHP